MNKLTYKEAYDKIIQAYFKNEIQPFKDQFCFCGTLSPECNWAFTTSVGPYSRHEYLRMEKALLKTLVIETIGCTGLTTERPYCGYYSNLAIESHQNYEEALFNAMCAALEVLKEIHIARGEKIDDTLEFTKRNHPNLQLV